MNFENIWSNFQGITSVLSQNLFMQIVNLLKYALGLTQHLPPSRLPQHSPVTQLGQQCSQNQPKHRVRKTYKKYTQGQKKQAVQRIQRGQDMNEVAKSSGIPLRYLITLKRFGYEKKKRASKRASHLQMQQTILAKIKMGQLNDQSKISKLAVKLSKKKYFKASKRWFFNFCKKHQLQLQKYVKSQLGQFAEIAAIQPTDSHLI